MDGQVGRRAARGCCCPFSATCPGDELDLGFPGEEALAGRYCRRLDCDGGSFVGPGGTVTVACDGGWWAGAGRGGPASSTCSSSSTSPRGERNDVSIRRVGYSSRRHF